MGHNAQAVCPALFKRTVVNVWDRRTVTRSSAAYYLALGDNLRTQLLFVNFLTREARGTMVADTDCRKSQGSSGSAAK